MRELLRILKGLFPSSPYQWAGTFFAFLFVGGLAAAVVVFIGLPNLKASQPHASGWARMLHYAFRKSVAFHAPEMPQIDLQQTDKVMLGAAHYANFCANCHGAPGLGQSPLALSLRPEPPQIRNAAERYSPAELFYIVQHGAAYANMPAWPVLDRPDEVWAVVAFLEQLPDMSHQRFRELAFNEESPLRAGPGQSQSLPTFAFGASPEEYRLRTDDNDAPENGNAMPGDPESTLNLGEGPAATRPAVGFLPAVLDGNPLALCVRCHGVDGVGRREGAFPNLTLQSEPYLYNSLIAYALGKRHSGVMWPIAAQLSQPQIEGIARLYGEMEAQPSLQNTEFDATMLARGETIASEGIRYGEADAAPDLEPGEVAACNSCHGQVGQDGRIFPNLAGQYQAYLANQLRVFRDGGRGDMARYNPMEAISHNLTDADIEAVANYYASLAPRAKSVVGTTESDETGTPGNDSTSEPAEDAGINDPQPSSNQ